MQSQILLFDLDDTLYTPESGVWEAISFRIEEFIEKKLQFQRSGIPPLRERLYKTYGTTLLGLMSEFQIDSQEYLNFVHDIPLEEYLSPDPSLRQLLVQFPHQKVIFTNADRQHAMRVLTILGLEDLFSQVIDILDIRPYCKPMPEAYRIALEILGNPDPRHCVLIDDRLVNIEAAIGMGMGGVWLSYGTNQSNHTRAVKTLSDLASVIPV